MVTVAEQFKLSGTLSTQPKETIRLPLNTLDEILAAPMSPIGGILRPVITAEIRKVTGEIDLTLGAKMDIPANAVATLDMGNAGNNKFEGWVPQFSINPTVLKGEVTVEAAITPQISAELDFQVLSKGLAAGLSMSAPTPSIELDGQANTQGDVCGGFAADV